MVSERRVSFFDSQMTPSMRRSSRQSVCSPTQSHKEGIDFKIRTIELGDKKIKLQIWFVCTHPCTEIQGHGRARAFPHDHHSILSWGDGACSCCGRGVMVQGIILVYDITNEKSFDNIKTWIRFLACARAHSRNIEANASSDVEKMMIGNKCDMDDKRVISKEQGAKVCHLSSHSTVCMYN